MFKRFFFYSLVAVLMGSCSKGQNITENLNKSDVPLPINLSSNTFIPLINLVDNGLQNELIKRINTNKKWAKLISQKKMAVGVVDLRDPNHPRFARVNGAVMMYAASLPKIAILLAAMDAMEKGELNETEEIDQDLRIMISKSDNAAATRMIDLLGYEKIESVLTDPRYDLYDDNAGGGLWVGKRYAKYGDRYPEHIKGLSHAATVTQVCRYYYMLVYGKLVSFERSAQMLEIMSDPEIHHKFVNTLEHIAPRAKLFRKSGSWQNFHSDSILVWGPERRYILVGLIEDPGGEQILRDLVLAIEEVLNTSH